MATLTQNSRATVDELYCVSEKAELINGEIVRMPATGAAPGYAGDEIFISLRDYVRMYKHGRAVGDNKAFIVNLPHRQSFSPDAAFHIGSDTGMKFYEGAPIVAVEVRSESDYGPQAERKMAQKRADYFAAGTRVVWDVDLLSPDVVKSYRSDAPDSPTVYRRGDIAEALGAVPGWQFPVDDLFA